MQEIRGNLQGLAEELKNCKDDRQRLNLLQNVSLPSVEYMWKDEKEELILRSLMVIEQEDLILSVESVRELIQDLIPVEEFYRNMGGIVGYHTTMMNLWSSSQDLMENKTYFHPSGIDISLPIPSVLDYIVDGIRALPELAELYPVGGAADRLSLIDPKTQAALPAAKLVFCGKTLLEGLIADVQAREYLYYKIWDHQIVVPVAMMTSREKDNHEHIHSICEHKKWFGRPKDSFQFFCQPTVPLIDKEGKWCCSSQRKLLMKPGGHGVVWKVAQENGVFDAWESAGKKKILVRQINNPIAGCDYGLLAFIGKGHRENKTFGFSSCLRQVQCAEGVNVLLEQKTPQGNLYCLTNVEYCNFKRCGIEDVPREEDSSYSVFPSNTNILFADIASIQQITGHCPLPGMIINLKKMCTDEEKEVARLESTMQNIADHFVDSSPEPPCEESLKTYLTFNARRKTISTTKKEYIPGGSLLETPEGCFYDLLHNAYDLLVNHCQFNVPSPPEQQDYISRGPSFVFLYHPSLGPLYSIIGQKLRGGTLALHGEIQLDIAEIDAEDLTVDGSLLITAEQSMGHLENGLIHYSNQTGKCRLKKVIIQNLGIDRSTTRSYWGNEISRQEACQIVLCGDGEFIAEDVTLAGDMQIIVESGYRVTAVEREGKLHLIHEKKQGASWSWQYHLHESLIQLIQTSVQQ